MARPDLEVLRRRVETSYLGRCVRAFVDLQGLDRAMVIASQGFTALIPLLIIVSAILPAGSSTAVADAVIRKFALSGDSAAAVTMVFAHPDMSSIRVGSLLLLVYSGVSLTRRMQRMYLQAWGLPPIRGVRGSFNAALGLAAILVEIALLYLVRSLLQALPFDRAFSVPLSIVGSLLLWTSIPWLLMDRRISWRRLLPSGALAGTCAAVYSVATTVYMPVLIERYSERYGLFGVTIALVGWLLCISLIMVVAAVMAAELDRAPERWARAVRVRFGAGDEDGTGAHTVAVADVTAYA